MTSSEQGTSSARPFFGPPSFALIERDSFHLAFIDDYLRKFSVGDEKVRSKNGFFLKQAVLGSRCFLETDAVQIVQVLQVSVVCEVLKVRKVAASRFDTSSDRPPDSFAPLVGRSVHKRPKGRTSTSNFSCRYALRHPPSQKNQPPFFFLVLFADARHCAFLRSIRALPPVFIPFG